MTVVPAEHQGKRPLQVGVFLDGDVLPAWLRRCIAAIQSSPCSELVLVMENGSRGRSAGNGSALFRLHHRLDEKLFRMQPDAFELQSVEPLVEGVARLTLHATPEGEHDRYDDVGVAAVREHRLDVVLWLGARRPVGPMTEATTHGLWRHVLGAQEPGGFAEVMYGLPVTTSGLQWMHADPAEDRMLYLSHASTDARSPRRNANQILWKTAAFAQRKLAELHDTGELTVLPSEGTHAPAPVGPLRGKTPGNLHTLLAMLRLGRRFVRDRLENRRALEQWQLALRLGGGPLDLDGYHPVVPPKDRIWADPFVLCHAGRNYVFLEECPVSTGRGHIAVMEVDAQGEYHPPRTVLQRDYHLSYPFLLQWQGEVYMIPESSQNRTVEMYRCTSFPDAWELHSVLLDDVIAVDPTLFEWEGRWWMFVNQSEDGASNWDELHLYHAAQPFGPWTPHRRNPVKSDVRSSRPAGRVFRMGEAWIRPAQDCALRYGHATVLNRIRHLEVDRYEEVEVGRLMPNEAERVVATHTLNAAGELFVIDQKVRRPRKS